MASLRTNRGPRDLSWVRIQPLWVLALSVFGGFWVGACASLTPSDVLRQLALVTVACLDEGELGQCEQACNAQVPEACLMLGDLWAEEDASTGERRHVVAWEWACQLGSSTGCVKVAEAIEGDEDVDPSQVGLHLEVACGQGDVAGCLGLAAWLASPEHEWTDPERAWALYEAFCERDVAAACEALAEPDDEASDTTVIDDDRPATDGP